MTSDWILHPSHVMSDWTEVYDSTRAIHVRRRSCRACELDETIYMENHSGRFLSEPCPGISPVLAAMAGAKLVERVEALEARIQAIEAREAHIHELEKAVKELAVEIAPFVTNVLKFNTHSVAVLDALCKELDEADHRIDVLAAHLRRGKNDRRKS